MMRPMLAMALALGSVGLWAAMAALSRAKSFRKLQILLNQHAAALSQLRAQNLPLVLVTDIGSSSVRTSAFACSQGRDGAVDWVLVEGSMAQIPLQSIDEHGNAQLQLIQQTVETTMTATMNVLRAAKLLHNVRGVGFSSFGMNLVGVDDKGAAVTPVFTYAGRSPSTARCAKELRKLLRSRGVSQEFHNRTGTTIHQSYAAPLFAWLAREQQDVVEHVTKWQTVASYLIGRWTGTGPLPISFSEASWTGLLDFRRKRWDPQLLNLVHMDTNKMPLVQDSSSSFTGLSSSYLRKWPELAETPFFLGLVDGAAANIGSRCLDKSRVALTVGTSAAMRVMVPLKDMANEKVPGGLWCYAVDGERVLVGGALNDGGSIYQWARSTIAISDEDCQSNLENQQPNAHGLVVLPFISGERAPGWVDNATCAIAGVTKWTKPIDILRAVIESVSLRLSLVFSLLATHCKENAVLVASGTALSASRIWRQILADCIGREVVMESDAIETTSRGVAIALGVALGLHSMDQAQHLPQSLVSSKPHVSSHAIYLQARNEQEMLYRKMYGEEQE